MALFKNQLVDQLHSTVRVVEDAPDDFDALMELIGDARVVMIGCPVKLEIVPGATHLFEEPGALERVAQLVADWFQKYLARKSAGAAQ